MIDKHKDNQIRKDCDFYSRSLSPPPGRDLNRQPPAYQANGLPTELSCLDSIPTIGLENKSQLESIPQVRLFSGLRAKEAYMTNLQNLILKIYPKRIRQLIVVQGS